MNCSFEPRNCISQVLKHRTWNSCVPEAKRQWFQGQAPDSGGWLIEEYLLSISKPVHLGPWVVSQSSSLESDWHQSCAFECPRCKQLKLFLASFKLIWPYFLAATPAPLSVCPPSSFNIPNPLRSISTALFLSSKHFLQCSLHHCINKHGKPIPRLLLVHLHAPIFRGVHRLHHPCRWR